MPGSRAKDRTSDARTSHARTGNARADARTGNARTRSARTAASHSRRRRRSRLRLTLAIALSLLVLVSGGIGWVYFKLTGNIETFSSRGLADNRPPSTAKGQNVLVIGSDARTDGNSSLGGGDKGDIGRSDTAFLLHVYGDGRHAVAVSIPRDTLLDIPPCRLPDGSWTEERTNAMFNSAFSVGQTAKGNPACTQNTVEKLTGLRVDHTIVVDFKGFAKMTEVVGGVKVCLPTDIYQRDLNPNRATRGDLIFKKGVQNLSGVKALDYVRIRHGIGDGSDIGRIKRQQAFVGSLIKQVKSDGLTPTKLLPLANAATRSMTVDSGLGSADKLLGFMMGLKDIDLHNTKFVTIPWRYQGARVAIVEPDASRLWAALRVDRTVDGTDASGKKGTEGKDSAEKTAEPTPSGPSGSTAGPVSGAGIAVAVYNGTTVTGLAARGGRTLMDHGFVVTGTATAATQDYGTTVIEYGPGEEAGAGTTARLFPGAKLRQTAAEGINVILGSSFADDPTAHPTAGTETGGTSSVPSGVADDARSADDDPCSNLSYG
ncbi:MULTISPECIES: LCP family protein [unclassified Streptomyces]|uniref:LCP family protein n=1 Tax=unclassified Streptomyces TaxID=2593676 RepID=UPI00380074F2